jgi:FlaA1/EpsC-like NDP-sugar epimerase
MINKAFKKKTVLVTGASGSIGSKIVKKLLQTECRVVRALSNDENGIYNLGNILNTEIDNNINKTMLKNKIRFIIGDIKDFKRNLEVTRDVDIVIHAAAMKHVPICEYNPIETFKTNIEGTRKLVKASIVNKVKKFLFISTDKAVNPTNVMGKSKLKAENIVLGSNFKQNHTIFSVIRFGNIIGSRGSVLPFFISQIKNKKNITLTDINATRFFITINSATKEIFNAISVMKGEELFVINNMKSFKIIDLIKSLKIIFNYNKKVKIVGLRHGEKLHESLLTDKELSFSTVKNNLIIINNQKKFFKKKINKNFIENLSSETANHLTKNEIISFLKNNFNFSKIEDIYL